MARALSAFERDLGHNIRCAREAAGITQEKLATEVGIPRTAVLNIEKGSQSVTIRQLVAIGKAVNVSYEKLVPEHVDRLNNRPERERLWLTGSRNLSNKATT